MNVLHFALKLTIVISLVIILSTKASAQSREIGLTMDRLNWQSVNLVYKTQITENEYWRFNLAHINIGIHTPEESDYASRFGLGLGIGKEKRQALSERVDFVRGLNGAIGFNHQKNKFNDNNYSYANHIYASIGYLVGLRYNFKNNLAVGLEINPSIRVENTSTSDYQSGVNKSRSNLRSSFDFSKDTFVLALNYSF